MKRETIGTRVAFLTLGGMALVLRLPFKAAVLSLGGGPARENVPLPEVLGSTSPCSWIEGQSATAGIIL